MLGRYDVTPYNVKGQIDWTVQNMMGYTGGALPANPPAYSLSQPYDNVATLYQYHDLGRQTMVTETGRGGLAHLQYAAGQ